MIGIFFLFAINILDRTSFLFVMHAPQCIINLYGVISGKSCPDLYSKFNSKPNFFVNNFGIFTLAMSSSMAWWEQLSRISTLSCGFNVLILFAPLIKVCKSPLSLAKRIENEVKLM